MPTRNIIVIGASAGGIAPVRALLSKFPKTISAAMFVVVHTSPDGPGMLATVLNRATELSVVDPQDGMVIRDGCVYVAPPDYHLVIDGRYVHLTHGPREHRFRPAVDPLFRTAAKHYGERVIGIVLSGHMADGTRGLSLIKKMGGVAIAQDPHEAEVPAMPLNAMRRGEVDYVLPVDEIPRVITGLLRKGRPARTQASRPPSKLTCRKCGGALWELKESLRDGDAMDEKLEDTLWSALRAIEENIELRTRMKTRATDRRLTGFSATLDQDISDLEQRAAALRQLLLGTQDHAKPRAEKPRKRQAHG